MRLLSFKPYRQFYVFVWVGLIATGIHYVILFALVNLTPLSPVSSSAIGFTLSALVNYALNYKMTFQSKATHKKAIMKFGVVAFIGLLLNSVLMNLGIKAGLPILYAQIIATGVILIWNFVINKFWTFSNKLM